MKKRHKGGRKLRYDQALRRARGSAAPAVKARGAKAPYKPSPMMLHHGSR